MIKCAICGADLGNPLDLYKKRPGFFTPEQAGYKDDAIWICGFHKYAGTDWPDDLPYWYSRRSTQAEE